MAGDYTSPADEAHFAAIGRLTLSWAHLEAGLDFCIIISYQQLGGDQIQPEIPRALQRKLQYLRKAFASLPALAPYRDRFAPLADQISSALETRHDIIHGVVVAHISENGEAQTATLRLLWQRTGYGIKARRATTTEILRHAVHANKLAGQSLSLGSELVERFWRK